MSGRYNRRVINYYQPFLWPFLHWRRSHISSDIQQRYWFSFEDALWELLPERGIRQGSLILLPDFYCIDVVENMQAHGYKTAFYAVDDQFQINETVFKTKVMQLHPAVVILFHVAGIQCQLATQSVIQWLSQQNCLVIEDCVHRLVDPSTVQLFDSHHIVMDSLRKVSPLPGSMVYEPRKKTATAQLHPPKITTNHTLNMRVLFAEFLYQYQATSIFIFFRLIQALAVLTRSAWLMRYAHQVILKKHDDLVGDSHHGYLGWRIGKWLHSFINFAKVETVKQQQIRYYSSLLHQVFNQQDNFFYQIKISIDDEPRMHVYPLGLQKPITTHQLDWLHQHGVVVWPKFSDSPWAKNRGVLFLPLGFHVTDNDIKHTISVISRLPNCG